MSPGCEGTPMSDGIVAGANSSVVYLGSSTRLSVASLSTGRAGRGFVRLSDSAGGGSSLSVFDGFLPDELPPITSADVSFPFDAVTPLAISGVVAVTVTDCPFIFCVFSRKLTLLVFPPFTFTFLTVSGV